MDGPLKDEHCECLNRALQMNSECGALIAALKECGLDVSAFEEDNNAKRDLAQGLKRKFFPHRT